MPKKLKVNTDKLIKAVQSGEASTEIMKKFGIKTSAQLKTLYLDALVEKGNVSGIVSTRGRGKPSAKEVNEIVVNKRGSLVIPRKMVEEFGFEIGEAFKVRKTKAGISLKQIG